MKALLAIFSLFLILLFARLWVGTGSYPERWKTQEKTTIQQASNQKKRDDIETIKADLRDVKSGQDAIEGRARSELGMTKKGETYFEVILQDKTDSEELESLEKPAQEKAKPENK